MSAASEDAVNQLRKAASLGQHVAPGERAEMLFHLGSAERAAGSLDDAVEAWNRAIEIYEAQADIAAIARVCDRAAWDLLGGGRLTEGYEVAQRGLLALGDRPSVERGRLLGVAGFSIAFAGRYEEGMAHITDALELGERLGDPVLTGHALSWKTAIHHVFMEGRDTVESGWRSADILRSVGELWQLSTTLSLVAFSAAWAGRFADVRQAAAEADELAERFGNHAAVMVSGRGQAMTNWSEGGELAGLEEFTHRDMQLCTDAGLQWISWSWSWLATVAFLRGDWDTALRHAAKAEELSPPGVINGAEWALRLEFCAYARTARGGLGHAGCPAGGATASSERRAVGADG